MAASVVASKERPEALHAEIEGLASETERLELERQQAADALARKDAAIREADAAARRAATAAAEARTQLAAWSVKLENAEAKLAEIAAAPDDETRQHLHAQRDRLLAKAAWLDETIVEIIISEAQNEVRDFRKWDYMARAQYLEAHPFLSNFLLSSQGDRMSMAHGVEVRHPFLDHRLVEFCNRGPPRVKMRGLSEKSLLKKAMAGRLPKTILKRPKQPYRAPESRAFLRSRVGAAVLDHMSGPNVNAAGYFDSGLVQRLVAKCEKLSSTGFRDNLAFVGILSTQVWHETFVNGLKGRRGMAVANQMLSALRSGASATPAHDSQ